MRHPIYFLAPCLLTSLLMGCGGKEAALVGKWTAVATKATNGQTNKQIDGVLARLSLELKPDKHFTLAVEEGTWSVADGRLTLKVATINGKTIDETKKQYDALFKQQGAMIDQKIEALRTQVGTISDDGKTISLPLSGAGGVEIIYNKKAQ